MKFKGAVVVLLGSVLAVCGWCAASEIVDIQKERGKKDSNRNSR